MSASLLRVARKAAITPRAALRCLSSRSAEQQSIEEEMRALSQSGNPKAPERILSLLVETTKEWRSSSTTAAPTMAMFHTAMTALAKSATHHRQRSVRAVAQQIEDILHLILDKQQSWNLQPTLRTYLIVLGAWQRVEMLEQMGHGAARAESILKQMMLPFAEKKKMVGSHLHPNAQCFVTVMVAWIHAGHIEKAESIYQKMIQLHKLTKKEKIRPTMEIANSVLIAWAKASPARPDRILEFLHQLAVQSQVYPNRQSLNILLSSYAKLGHYQKAWDVLCWMEDPNHQTPVNHPLARLSIPSANQFDLYPDNSSYCNVIMALGKSKRLDPATATAQSQKLLARMKGRGLTPDRFVYTALIHNQAIWRDPHKVETAFQLWRECPDPDVACSVAFLQVCSHALFEERPTALQLAIFVYEAIDERHRNAICYLTMAKVVNYLAGSAETTTTSPRWTDAIADRRSMLRLVAGDCCHTGHLGRMVRTELERKSRSPTETVAAWMGSDRLRPEWSRNLPRREWPQD